MSTKYPQPSDVLFKLAPFLKVLWEALEGGATYAHAVAEARQRDYQPAYQFENRTASDLTRSFAKQYLRDHLEAFEVTDVELEKAAMIGLRARVGEHQIWVWKSPDDRIPYPGSSKRKRRFLNQGFQMVMDLPDCPLPTKLVVLWCVDAGFKFAGMFLALPKSPPDEIFKHPSAWWTIAVPHPAELMDYEPETGLDSGELPFDLPDFEDDEQIADGT